MIFSASFSFSYQARVVCEALIQASQGYSMILLTWDLKMFTMLLVSSLWATIHIFWDESDNRSYMQKGACNTSYSEGCLHWSTVNIVIFSRWEVPMEGQMENRSCQLTKLIEIIHREPSDTCRLNKYTITPPGHNYISKLILNPFPGNRYCVNPSVMKWQRLSSRMWF